jgi:hypothetical protein
VSEMSKLSKSPIVFTGVGIGQISAEADDEFLFDCFIDHPALTQMKDPASPKMILLGSTGVGKTAILRMIERTSSRVHSIELDELSLGYIGNSNVIAFLNSLDVSIDHFLQAMWKHVICIEYIKLRYNTNTQQKSSNFFSKLKERFVSDPAKQKALKYLEKWETKFWVSFDETAKEITKALETEISLKFGAELDRFLTDAGFVKKLSLEKKSQLQQRLKEYVNADQLSDLAHVIRLLADYDVDAKATNYVLIDRLDDNWADDSVRYQLIRSLIEALKSMRRISDLKVIVSLRSDLMEKVILETKENGFQSEKYEDYVARLTWSADQLKELVNKRINFLFRRKYTRENIFFEDIFIEKVHKEKAFNYLLERTLYRPRDIISFVNGCFLAAKGKTQVGQSEVTTAEGIYSQGRLDALFDEWRSVYPGVEPSVRILAGRRESFSISELNTSQLPNELVSLFYEDNRFSRDPIYDLLDEATSSSGDGLVFRILTELIERLHLIGVVGVNTGPTQPFQWFYKSQRKIGRSNLKSDSKIRIHPMIHSALAIR